MNNTICPKCNKPYWQNTNSTVTLASSVWPYCQCGAFTITYTLTSGATGATIYTGYIPQPEREDVPQAFQDAFSDGELEL